MPNNTGLTDKDLRFYFDQAKINVGLRQDNAKLKATINQQATTHQTLLQGVKDKYEERLAGKDSTIADYQKLEVGYIAENKGLRKQVKKQKFLKNATLLGLAAAITKIIFTVF